MSSLMKDYTLMLVGIAFYVIGYTCFMLPYEIVSGGMGGVAALIFYATGFPAQYSYFLINCILLAIAFYVMGWRYTTRTLAATAIISIAIGFAQDFLTQDDGTLTRIVGDEIFMACVLSGCFEGLGLAIVFQAGGSTGGTDIIASCVNKHRDIQLGRIMLFIDIFIVFSSYFVVGDFQKTLVGFICLFISMSMLDYVLNSANQSVQFTIISEHYEEIANAVAKKVERGVTVLNGEGWYSKEPRSVLLVLAKKREKQRIMRIVRKLDQRAFVSVSNVEGVFGEGFDKIKH
ncbi:MAG: YitT family protein [Bacteroidales bacterium]|nr:YitT family protein [Candidatus Physcousia equi]